MKIPFKISSPNFVLSKQTKFLVIERMPFAMYELSISWILSSLWTEIPDYSRSLNTDRYEKLYFRLPETG